MARARILDLQSISVQPSLRDVSLQMTPLEAGDELIAAVTWFPQTAYRWRVAEIPEGVEARETEHMIPEEQDPANYEQVLSSIRFIVHQPSAGPIILRLDRPQLAEDEQGLTVRISFVGEDD